LLLLLPHWFLILVDLAFAGSIVVVNTVVCFPKYVIKLIFLIHNFAGTKLPSMLQEERHRSIADKSQVIQLRKPMKLQRRETVQATGRKEKDNCLKLNVLDLHMINNTGKISCIARYINRRFDHQ
jgi:hypothetical protein